MNQNIYPAQTWQVVCAVSIYASAAARPALTIRRHRVTPSSCWGSAAIISKRGEGVRGRLLICTCQVFRYAETHICLSFCMFCLTAFCLCEDKRTGGEAQSRERQEVGARPASPAAHPRRLFLFFTRCVARLFLDLKGKKGKKNGSESPLPPACKVFSLEKCMNGGVESKCGAHALLTRLHNPSHDSRSG